MNIRRIIRILTFQHSRRDEEQARFDANRARSDENIARINEILLRVSASQERAEKLLGRPNK